MITIRPATYDDHQVLVVLARQSRYTRDFSNHIFSGPLAYTKGWIRVAVDDCHGVIVGFTCVRHKVREPKTSLYFIVVDGMWKGQGVGSKLLTDLWHQTPHDVIHFNCAKDNDEALVFYERRGFEQIGDSLGGTAWQLQGRRDPSLSPRPEV